MSGGDEPLTHLSFHVGGPSLTRCSVYPDRAPILGVVAGRISLSLTVSDMQATPAAVEFARTLAIEAQRFADEMKRLHAVQFGGTDEADTRAA